MDDEIFIRRVLTGDREAFRALVDRHESAVWATLRALRASHSDCEDMAQEVFVSAFTHLATFDATRGSFRTWLLAIARNTCRTAKRRATISQPAWKETLDEDTPVLLAAQAEMFRRLDAALAALPEDQRLAFVLTELQGLSQTEAATVADVPVGTIKSRVFRAKEWLREALADTNADGREPPRPTVIPARELGQD